MLPQYYAEFTKMCNTILRNAAISNGIDCKLVKNTPNAARIGHELTEIRDVVRFDLTIVIKKVHPCFGGISSKMNFPRKAAVEFILQIERCKQLLI